MTRPARPDDLYRLLVPRDPRLSPDGRIVAFTVKTTAPGRDAYRESVWAASTDGSGTARRLTLGARTDRHARFSPDGRTLAFLSDRRLLVEEEPGRPRDAKDREDCDQVHLLPLDGGEARRLTDLPRGVESFSWSPDGRTLAVLTYSVGATREAERRRRGRPAEPKPGEPPLSDFRYIDRLAYQSNGTGFVDDHVAHLWLVDVETGAARPLVARADGGGSARVVAGRRPDRIHGQPAAPSRYRLPVRDVRRRRGIGPGDDGRWRRRRGVRRAGVAPGRLRDPGPRRPLPAIRVPDGDLALRGGRLRRGARRRPGPARRERAQAGCRDDQRRDHRRACAGGAGRRRRPCPVHRTDRRQLRAVAHPGRPCAASPSGSPGIATTCPAGTPAAWTVATSWRRSARTGCRFPSWLRTTSGRSGPRLVAGRDRPPPPLGY